MTVNGGVFGGTHTISVNSVDIYGGVLGGTNTITASSVQVAGGTLDGNNTITAPGGVYTDRDDNWMGPAGTIQGSGTINGDVHIWTGSYNGTHSITGNVDIQDYWDFDTGSPADSTFAGAANGGNLILFVSACCLILSMYGGGFATVPAYLAD